MTTIRESVIAASTKTDEEWARETIHSVDDAIAIGSPYDPKAAFPAARDEILAAGHGWPAGQETQEGRVVACIKSVRERLSDFFDHPGCGRENHGNCQIDLFGKSIPPSIKVTWSVVTAKSHRDGSPSGSDRRLRTKHVRDLIIQHAVGEMQDAYASARHDFALWVDSAPDVESIDDPRWVDWVGQQPR